MNHLISNKIGSGMLPIINSELVRDGFVFFKVFKQLVECLDVSSFSWLCIISGRDCLIILNTCFVSSLLEAYFALSFQPSKIFANSIDEVVASLEFWHLFF
jgi:hypothetical protein